MRSFADKVRMTRDMQKMSQTELGEKIGVTRRSICAYESGKAMPHRKMLQKLADALDVTVTYLTDPNEEDPHAGMARDMRVNAVRERFGNGAARELIEFAEKGESFFAGGDNSQVDKDVLFDILATAYYAAKSRASETFTPKSKRKKEE